MVMLKPKKSLCISLIRSRRDIKLAINIVMDLAIVVFFAFLCEALLIGVIDAACTPVLEQTGRAIGTMIRHLMNFFSLIIRKNHYKRRTKF